MRLPKIFDLQQFLIAESWKFLTIENHPELSRPFSAFDFHKNKSKIFPKLEFETPVQKYTGIFENSKNEFKTVLARTGAEKNSFLGFWVYFLPKSDQKWPKK